MTVTERRPALAAVEPAEGRQGWVAAWHVEVVKLAAQSKVRVALGACALGPVLFALALAVQQAVPADTPFGQWVHESGWAVSWVVLSFSGAWVLPVLVAVVAGDVCAEEDRHHTWSLLLTRARSRGEVLTGKLLACATYAVAATILLGSSATLTGVLSVGTQPVVGLSGSVLGTSAAFHALVLSWMSVLPPVLAFTAISALVSVVSRSSWVGVIVPVVLVLVLQLVSLLSVVDPIRKALPTTGFEAWHGLARVGSYSDQVWASVLVSALWVIACVAVAARVLDRRDVADA